MTEHTLTTPRRPRRVDPEHVETELMQLWNEVTNELDTDAVLRARSMTLVAFADTPAQQAELQETLAAVSRRHPSRAIVIVGQPDERPALETWVSVHCQMNDHTSLCNEQVMIEAGGDVLEQVVSLVLALVVPDLPIAVWWWGDVRPEMQMFDALYRLSDRFLLDATTFRHPIESLTAEATNLLTNDGYPVVADLAWEESTDWRELIAQLFDAPEWAARLPDLTRIRFFYDWTVDQPRNPTEAFLVAGWIANQLEWEPASAERAGDGEFMLRFDTQDRAVRVEIRPTDTPLNFEQGIAMMEMETDASPALRFHLSRDDDGVCGTLKVTQAGAVLHRRTVSLHVPGRVDALDRFLSHMGRNRLFGATLRMLAPLLQQV